MSNNGLPEGRLELRFEDKAPPFDPGEAAAEAARCLYCHDAPCITACPTSIDIPTFIRKIQTHNLRGSARTILEANLLGSSCSRVCPVEVLCEGSCVYVPWGRRPVSIGRLQRHAMDHAASPELLEKSPKRTGKKIALVGAGPASLACAGTLSLLGHDTVVFERDALPGGLNTTGVAPYKMEARAALSEASFIQSLGVTFKTGVEVGIDISPDELVAEYDFVFLGPGLGRDSALAAEGAEGDGIRGAVEWIREMKLDPQASLEGIRRVAIIGGGNTAVDATRELLGLGVPEVTMIYRRTEERMSGYAHEWSGAKKEGARMLENALVQSVRRSPQGALQGLNLVAAEDGRATGNALPSFDCDLVLVATGQAKLRALAESFEGVTCDDRGRVQCDPETGQTGNPKVYCGGDARNGGKEVVNAVDEGQRAARAMHQILQSR